MNIPNFPPLSEDEQKDIVIAQLIDSITIIEMWIREHVNGEEHATHNALLMVADGLKTSREEYKTTGLSEIHIALRQALFTFRVCLEEYEEYGKISRGFLSLARQYISKAKEL